MSPVPPWIFVAAGIGWIAIVLVIYWLMWSAARADRERPRCNGAHQG